MRWQVNSWCRCCQDVVIAPYKFAPGIPSREPTTTSPAQPGQGFFGCRDPGNEWTPTATWPAPGTVSLTADRGRVLQTGLDRFGRRRGVHFITECIRHHENGWERDNSGGLGRFSFHNLPSPRLLPLP
ncbi:hypothetical protein J6590_096879 [Homalodisca vitripennis]|nr:hypothetical protein J6590_096879 [Homalodisca vitripennis]